MSFFNRVSAEFPDLPYMSGRQAQIMRKLIARHDARDILEIGFYQGKSSAYLAAILEDLGRGHLVTIDREAARKHTPNIEYVLSALDLGHRVTPIFAQRSYTWEMAEMIRATPRPQFDLCYFDGGHTWDGTGFGFALVDLLLRPGGWIIFDDLPWTIQAEMQTGKKVPKHWAACSTDERATPAVQMVFDFLVPHRGYTSQRIINHGQWGIARKPFETPADRTSTHSGLNRVLTALRRR